MKMELRGKFIKPIAVGVLIIGILACKNDTSPPTPSAADVRHMRQEIIQEVKIVEQSTELYILGTQHWQTILT